MSDMSRRHFVSLFAALPILSVGAAQAATYGVTIRGMTFSPASFEVAAGDTIVFTNADGAPHTATAQDGAFDTGRIGPGQRAEVAIPPGRHPYVCQYHPMMTGFATAT